MRHPNRTILIAVFYSVIFFFNAITPGYCVQQPFSTGETMVYDIKKFNIKIGEAVLVFNGPSEVAGREAVSITFTARGFKFLDEEKIYLDPKTFYPLLIKRNLNIFGKKEHIIEFYDTNKGKVRVVKTAKGKTSQQVIEGDKRFDNIYGFIYRHRQWGQFIKNKKIHLHLPTDDVRFELVKREKFNAANREFDAYFLQSRPKKYEVLFDSGKQRIPLKIDGALGFGSMSMVLTEYRGDN